MADPWRSRRMPSHAHVSLRSCPDRRLRSHHNASRGDLDRGLLPQGGGRAGEESVSPEYSIILS